MTSNGDVRELIIIGGGPAGYTAALYAARAETQLSLDACAIREEHKEDETVFEGERGLYVAVRTNQLWALGVTAIYAQLGMGESQSALAGHLTELRELILAQYGVDLSCAEDVLDLTSSEEPTAQRATRHV